jgi:hypothetical protein
MNEASHKGGQGPEESVVPCMDGYLYISNVFGSSYLCITTEHSKLLMSNGKSGHQKLLENSWPLQACSGTALLFISFGNAILKFGEQND